MTSIPKADSQVDQWRSVMFLYDSALKKVNTKIEILNNEFNSRYDYNPIEHIKSRLKSADSIVKKLKKDGYEVTIETMMEHLSDIAGVRIICSFIFTKNAIIPSTVCRQHVGIFIIQIGFQLGSRREISFRRNGGHRLSVQKVLTGRHAGHQSECHESLYYIFIIRFHIHFLFKV